MVTILMMSAKMATLATLAFLKIKASWNKVYDVITSVHDVTNKILLLDTNYIVDSGMWPKFGNCSISVREVNITLILKLLAKKKLLADTLNKKDIKSCSSSNFTLSLLQSFCSDYCFRWSPYWPQSKSHIDNLKCAAD